MTQSNETPNRHRGGVIHTYQQYDPKSFPSPSSPPPDLVSPAFEHMLTYGSMREFTEEELAKAIKLDPGQFAGLCRADPPCQGEGLYRADQHGRVDVWRADRSGHDRAEGARGRESQNA